LFGGDVDRRGPINSVNSAQRQREIGQSIVSMTKPVARENWTAQNGQASPNWAKIQFASKL
jgi:hypothetical protein